MRPVARPSALSSAVLPVLSSQLTGNVGVDGFARHVEKSAGIRYRELRAAGVRPLREPPSTTGDSPPANLETLGVERNGEQRAAADDRGGGRC